MAHIVLFSGKWSLSHPDTKTDILMTSTITNTVTKATSDWQLDYKTMRAGKKTINIKTDVNKEDPEFSFKVSCLTHISPVPF